MQHAIFFYFFASSHVSNVDAICQFYAFSPLLIPFFAVRTAEDFHIQIFFTTFALDNLS